MYLLSEQLFSDSQAFVNLCGFYFFGNNSPTPSKNLATLMFPELLWENSSLKKKIMLGHLQIVYGSYVQL